LDPLKDKFIFDTSALLAYLNNEGGSALIEEILKKAERKDADVFITSMDVAEIYHIVLKEEGREKALKAIVLIKNLPIESVGLDESLLMAAGEIRVQFPLTLGDALVVAVAKSKDAKIITSDRDFKKVEGEVSVVWI
jgi:predicted nucleic acid-binding protein